MVDVQLSQDAGRFFATVSRTSFAVGRATKFPEAQGNRRGDRRMWGARRVPYRRGDQRRLPGLWGRLPSPDGLGRGGSLGSLNTYDKARFTFGFLQFAAPVPRATSCATCGGS